MSTLREEHAELDTIEHDIHTHPGPRRYVEIAVILAVCTAIEVGISYMSIPDGAKIPALIAVAIIKFALVVMWFMHLRFDSRLFTVMFFGGLGLAIAAFVVILTIMRVFFA